MRVETTSRTLYNFDELPEDIQEKAIEKLSSLNVYHEWWDSIYEDAERVFFKIPAFDIDRASYVTAEFMQSARDTAEKICEEHGKDCETVKTAKEFLDKLNPLEKKAEIEADKDDYDYNMVLEFENKIEDLEKQFKHSLQEDYRIILTKEYEWLTSEEQIIESIKANEYEFDKDGNLA